MDELDIKTPTYPKDLVDWAGNHSGGVKRLFDAQSGRGSRALLTTNLLLKLESWAKGVTSDDCVVPRIILLVGGPGNGKTEAIESTISWLDASFNCHGALIKELSKAFHPKPGVAVPRVVEVNLNSISHKCPKRVLKIVQDASVTAGCSSSSAPRLLIQELESLTSEGDDCIYLCCVNRGILDDALIHAAESENRTASNLLDSITQAVSLNYNAPRCWPLDKYPDIAVWPMDAESLLLPVNQTETSPAEKLLDSALDPQKWLQSKICPAGDFCPFCNSHSQLSVNSNKAALLQILRWYELQSGKRWSFRDLFSLFSYLLAGHRPSGDVFQSDPCKWAQYTVEKDKLRMQSKRSRKEGCSAIYELVASGYQQSLFHRWEVGGLRYLKQDLKDLGLSTDSDKEEVNTICGLSQFLSNRRTQYLPAMISQLLEGIAFLDPAMTSPNERIALSSRTEILLGDLDQRFSRSLSDGFEFIRKSRPLSANETELLKRLVSADEYLAKPSVRSKKPTAATRLQFCIRDFACRLVRRSLCTKLAKVYDNSILAHFQHIVDDETNGLEIHKVAKQVKNLLNNNDRFEISLTTTFGQPLSPLQRQATLVVPARQVKGLEQKADGRPKSPICFLSVGSGASAQPIALTYDLFKAVNEIAQGLSPSSLPQTVVALLDTTRSRLSGTIVRDRDLLGDARILVGSEGVAIEEPWEGGFVAVKEGSYK